MSWTRGSGTTDQELARAQWWIERADVDLYGPDGDDGVIREHRDGRAAQGQQDKDIVTLIKIIGWVVGLPATGAFILSLLRAFHQVN